MSIVGLASKTGPIIIGLVITLDFSKVIIASVLYKNWGHLNWALKTIFLPVCVVLVLVTSSGAFAYILKEFGNITNDSEKEKIVLQINQEEKEKLEERKKSLEEQVAQLPANYVRQRANLMNTFKPELDEINSRLEVINNEIKTAKTSRFDSSNDSTNSTIGSIAKVYNLPPDQVNRILALFITIMIDPLAIALLTLANFLSSLRNKLIAETKIKDYVEKTRSEKIKELLFGKNIPIQYPEVNVSFQDISNEPSPTEEINIRNFIKSCELQDNKIKDNGLSNLKSDTFVQEIHSDITYLKEELNISSFIVSCKLKENEYSLFEEPLISSKDLEQFKLFSKPVDNLSNINEISDKVLLNEVNDSNNDSNNEKKVEIKDIVLSHPLNFDVSKENEDKLDIIVDHINNNDDNNNLDLDLFLDANNFSSIKEELETVSIVDDVEDTGFDLKDITKESVLFDESNIPESIFQPEINTTQAIEHLWIDDPKVRAVYEREKEASIL